MKNQFSDDQIIRFLYNEMSPSESESFMEALYSDESLWQRYEALLEVTEAVADLQYSPSEQTIENIKAFVRETATEQVVPVQKTPVVTPLWQRIPKDLPLKAVATVAMLLFLGVAITGSIFTVGQGRKAITSIERPEHTVQVVDADYEPQFQWDDSDIERELDEIRNRVQEIKATL